MVVKVRIASEEAETIWNHDSRDEPRTGADGSDFLGLREGPTRSRVVAGGAETERLDGA